MVENGSKFLEGCIGNLNFEKVAPQSSKNSGIWILTCKFEKYSVLGVSNDDFANFQPEIQIF